MNRAADNSELLDDLVHSDALADDAEHRWRQGNVALAIGVGLWVTSVWLYLVERDVGGCLTLFVGFAAFCVLGSGIHDWGTRIMRRAIDVITYEDEE